jgi:peroxiredoxin
MLEPGQPAPAFSLQALDGAMITLDELREKGPVLVAFFKISCPTCQLTFPFLERVNQSGVIPVVGISQDDEDYTEAFNARYGVTFTTLLDPENKRYAVSNAYKITHVPTQFLIQPDGTIAQAWSGFSKADIEQIAGPQIFRPGENVPERKPG